MEALAILPVLIVIGIFMFCSGAMDSGSNKFHSENLMERDRVYGHDSEKWPGHIQKTYLNKKKYNEYLKQGKINE